MNGLPKILCWPKIRIAQVQLPIPLVALLGRAPPSWYPPVRHQHWSGGGRRTAAAGGVACSLAGAAEVARSLRAGASVTLTGGPGDRGAATRAHAGGCGDPVS